MTQEDNILTEKYLEQECLRIRFVKKAFDCFDVVFLFIGIWFVGVIVLLYPLFMGGCGVTQYWEFDFSDKSRSIEYAGLFYYLVSGKLFFVNENQGIFLSFIQFLKANLVGNLILLQTMAVLVDAMPERPKWQNGITLLRLALILIPSGLFLSKPLTAASLLTEAFRLGNWIVHGTARKYSKVC